MRSEFGVENAYYALREITVEEEDGRLTPSRNENFGKHEAVGQQPNSKCTGAIVAPAHTSTIWQDLSKGLTDAEEAS